MSTPAGAASSLAMFTMLVDDKVREARRQAAIRRRLVAPPHNTGQLGRGVTAPQSSQVVIPDDPESWTTEKVRMVETVTGWLNSVGAEVGPNPQEASTIEEFVAQLRLLYEWAGKSTLRELEKRAGTGKLPRSSVSDMLRRTDRLPKIDLVTEFVKACGAGEALPAWIAAWHRLKRPRTAVRQKAA